MKISIRKHTCNGLPAFTVFRFRSRTWSIATAYECPPSGLWVVYLGGLPVRAVANEKEAIAMVKHHFAVTA